MEPIVKFRLPRPIYDLAWLLLKLVVRAFGCVCQDEDGEATSCRVGPSRWDCHLAMTSLWEYIRRERISEIYIALGPYDVVALRLANRATFRIVRIVGPHK